MKSEVRRVCTMWINLLCKVIDVCQIIAFGEIEVVWYGWNRETSVSISEVRMRNRKNNIIKGLLCHVIGCGQIYPMENFYGLLKALVIKL